MGSTRSDLETLEDGAVCEKTQAAFSNNKQMVIAHFLFNMGLSFNLLQESIPSYLRSAITSENSSLHMPSFGNRRA
jgi:hypothetical protein